MVKLQPESFEGLGEDEGLYEYHEEGVHLFHLGEWKGGIPTPNP